MGGKSSLNPYISNEERGEREVAIPKETCRIKGGRKDANSREKEHAALRRETKWKVERGKAQGGRRETGLPPGSAFSSLTFQVAPSREHGRAINMNTGKEGIEGAILGKGRRLRRASPLSATRRRGAGGRLGS